MRRGLELPGKKEGREIGHYSGGYDKGQVELQRGGRGGRGGGAVRHALGVGGKGQKRIKERRQIFFGGWGSI